MLAKARHEAERAERVHDQEKGVGMCAHPFLPDDQALA